MLSLSGLEKEPSIVTVSSLSQTPSKYAKGLLWKSVVDRSDSCTLLFATSSRKGKTDFSKMHLPI